MTPLSARLKKRMFVTILFLLGVALMAGCQSGTPTPTPTPGPTPVPVVDDGVGLAGAASAANETERQLAQASGAGWDRLAMWWHEIQDSTTGELHPEVYDGALESEPLNNVLTVLTARSNYPGVVGIDTECVADVRAGGEISPDHWDGQYGLCVTYQGYIYDYEAGNLVSSEPPLVNGEPNPNNPWAMFVYYTSKHHRDFVNAWEIFNEHEAGFSSGWDPNCNCETDQKYYYLPPSMVYAQLIRDAITVIRATNSGESSILGSAWQTDAEAITQGNNSGWYAQVLRDLAQGHIDDDLGGVGLHTYGWPRLSYNLITGLRDRAASPFWLTETGVHIGQPDPLTGNCSTGQPCGSEEEQAAYVVQQYVWALKAFHDTDRQGKVFHFAFKDFDVLPWGLLNNGVPREAYDAFQFIVRTLHGATYEEFEELNGHIQMTFTNPTERISVLWATAGSASRGYLSADVEATESQANFYDQTGVLVDVQGDPSNAPIEATSGYYNIRLPIATHPKVIDIQTDERMIGGRVYILIESTTSSTVPTLDITPTCKNGRPVGVDFLINDGGAGYKSLSVVASPEQVYDLSELTQPGISYYGTIDQIPAIGAAATVTLTNQAGVSVVRTLTNPGSSYCTNNPQAPGNSTPDETHSAASTTIPTGQFLALPAGSRSAPQAAILNRGASHDLWRLALGSGEPVSRIEPDFDPVATVEQYPVLIIPSGGLYGMESSTSFRARLEEYARLGGVIIAFDQQRGYEYAALPGGQVGGYGWVEDMACTGASLTMTNWHPALAGFNRASINAHVDGYFTSWPKGTQTLLSRQANGQPGAILYPYGEGWVFATTLYDDWGMGNGQSYADARVLLRDLITWALSPDDLPEYAPGDTVTLDVPVTNTGSTAATGVTLRLINPARQVSLTDTQTITIEAGDTVNVPFTTTAGTSLGIWRVDAVLLDDAGGQVAANDQAAAYAVARPPAMVDPARPLYLNITASDDTFALGSTAHFDYHVYNYGDTSQTVTVSYAYNHGAYQVLPDGEEVVVPPAENDVPGHVAIPHDVVIRSTFRLRGHVTSGDYQAYADYGVVAGSASVFVDAALAPAEVRPTETTTLTATLRPAWSWAEPVDAVVSIRATDGTGYLYYSYTGTEPVSVSGSATSPTVITHEIDVPLGVKPGTGSVWISLKTPDGRTLGGGAARLTLPSSPLALSPNPPPPLEGDTTASFQVDITNTSPDQAVEHGDLTLTLTTPDSGITPTGSVPFAVQPSTTETVTALLALPALHFGQYTLRVDIQDEYGIRYAEVTWDIRLQMQGTLDSPTHDAGQTASLALELVNPGPFVLPLTVTATSDGLPYTHSEPLTVQPYSTLEHILSIPVPMDVEVGSYPITLELALPSGDALTQEAATLQVPPSDLACTFEPPAEAQPGDTITATVTNQGGARTSGTYRLELHDAAWNLLQSDSGTLPNLDPDVAASMPIGIPQGAVSGRYTLTCRTENEQTEEVRSMGWPVTIAGVVTQLNVFTDQEVYPVDETLTVTADVNNTGADLPDGQLDLRVTKRQEDTWPAWKIYTKENSGLSSNWATSVTVDNVGNVWNVWVGDYSRGDPMSANMLSPDSTTWTTYALPIDYQREDSVNAIVIDAYNRKWMATDRGVARLSADNATWDIYKTSNSDLACDRVYSVAVDGEGNAWFGTGWGGANKLTNSGQWTTYTHDSTEGGLLSDWLYVVAVDDYGNVWFGTSAGLSKLTPAGDWVTYTVDSGLLSNYVYDIAFDQAGNVWLATPRGSSEQGGVSVLLADGSRQTYTPGTSDLSSEHVTSVAVDTAGRVWIGHNGYGVDVILPDGLTWLHFDGGSGEVLSSSLITDIAASPNGDVWLATSPYSEDEMRYTGGVTRAYSAGSGQAEPWTDSITLSLDSPDTFNDSRSMAAASLGATGKLYLEAELTSPTGQRVAYDEQPFYVFPGDVILTLDADPGLLRPGQPIHVSGMVENTGAAPLSGRTLTLAQDGVDIQTIGPFDLAPGEQRAFSVTVDAPDSTGPTIFTAGIDVDNLQVTETVEVGLPIVTSDLEIPDAAGSQSFPLVVSLTNTGPLDAAVELEIVADDPQIAGRQAGFTVLAGQVYRLEEAYTITQDTNFTLTFNGDFTETLAHAVTFGEALEAEFSPDDLYPEGPIAIPYSLTNTGQLAVLATSSVTIYSSISTFEEEISAYLLPEQTVQDTLLLDLAPGDYTLDYTTPFGAGTATFSVVPVEAATLAATAGPVDGGAITLTAQPANTGFHPIDGVIRVETSFMSADHPILLAAGGAETVELPIDLSPAEAGSYTATVTLLSSAGLSLASDEVSIDVPGAELVLTGVPDDTVVTAGELVTLTFEVANQGSAPAMAEIAIKLGDLLDETSSIWLPGGESGQIAFSFEAPDGLTGETLTGEFWFEGERHDLSLSIAGLNLEVSADWDQSAYDAGDTATLSVTVTNQAAVDAPPLYVHVSYNGEFFTQPLELAANGAQVLDFALTADAGADPKVFYAIYETGEERGVYLNTTYLYLRNADVTIVTDRSVYAPGDTVQATVYTTRTGTLTIKAPGLDTTLSLAGSNLTFDFVLPADLLRGTYTIDYALGEEVFSTPFDVDAVWVRVTEANLLDLPYVPGDTVRAELTVASTAALDVDLRAWLLYPDGAQSEESVSTVSLSGIANNRVQIELDLATAQAGPHRLVYLLVDPNDTDSVYVAGSETFDVGAAQVLGVHTDQDSYPLDSDPVSAVVTLYAEEAMSVHLDLLLDGEVIAGRDITLAAGVQTETISVPAPISPADHVLVARLTVGGLEHSASAGFAYGTDVVDLVAGSPTLVETGVGTRAVRAYVYNTGETASTDAIVQFWDGDPAGGGTLIGEQALPALEPGANTQIEMTWNVLGQAGLNTLTVLVDPDNQVTEYNKHNNAVTMEISIPDFDLEIESSASSYDEGEQALITLHAANLTQSAAGLVVTTTAANVSNEVVFTDAQTLTIPAASQVSRTIEWDTAQAANQVYTIYSRSNAEIDSNVLTVTIENVAPLVEAGPDQAISVGGTATFTGSFTDPGLADTHTIAWDFGDGMTAGGTLTSSHTYANSGVYVVTLTVTDNDGGIGSDTLTVTVSNNAPVVNAGDNAAIAEGDTFSGAGSFIDSDADGWTATVDYGDGSGIQPLVLTGKTFVLSHTYVDNGAYPVEVCVTDDNGDSGCDSLTVTVSNVAPVVDAGPDRAVDEGTPVIMIGSFTDPGTLDTHTIAWNFGDGTTASDTLSPSHTYADNGVYTVTLTVTDNDGGVGSDTLTVTVSNVVPAVYFSGPDTAKIGTPVTFEGFSADPGSADTHTIVWDFGDGSTLMGTLTATHAFSMPGSYTVTLTVTDDDGGVGQWEATIQVETLGLVVTSTGDGADSNTADGLCDDGTGACTLRAAIEQANATAGLDTITFNIPGSGTRVIQPGSALPYITDPVSIDGTTQPGYAGTPLIKLDGINAGGNVDGLFIRADDCTVRGLMIVRFSRNGIYLYETTGNSITDTFIGTDGSTALGNGSAGIRVDKASDNMLLGNLVSSNASGVILTGGTTGNLVQDNTIGADATGTLALGNTGVGITVYESGGNTIDGNLISGNGSDGISVGSTGAAQNLIIGNIIGLTTDGSAALGNSGSGILLYGGTSENTIGGTTEATRNVIAGNNTSGIYLTGSATGNLVQGNFIGTDVTGMVALGNAQQGIALNGTGANTIGGGAEAGNLVSGNGQHGIILTGGASGVVAQGNRVGTTVDGTAALGNGEDGIVIHQSGSNTLSDNLISANSDDGIALVGADTTGNTLRGNRVGTTLDGTSALGNADNGISIEGAPGNTIGGAEAGNLVSGNGYLGLLIYGSASTGNQVLGNRVGTDLAGMAGLGNANDGIRVDGATGNTLSGNLVSANGDDGIELRNSANGNTLLGNIIGLTLDGTAALGNAWDGIYISKSSQNTIGGAEAGAGNRIGGNLSGVTLYGNPSTGNAIRGNRIDANTGPGIDLYPEGVTANDTGDGDGGPNGRQNYPVLIAATSDATSTTVDGTLNSTADTTFDLDFYASPTCDASGHGEGAIYLGAGQVTTGADGNAGFSLTIPTAATDGWAITSTATDPNGNTSEFSACVTVTGGAASVGGVYDRLSRLSNTAGADPIAGQACRYSWGAGYPCQAEDDRKITGGSPEDDRTRPLKAHVPRLGVPDTIPAGRRERQSDR